MEKVQDQLTAPARPDAISRHISKALGRQKVSYKRPSIKGMLGSVFQYNGRVEECTFTLMSYEKDDFRVLYHAHSNEKLLAAVKGELWNPGWSTQSFYLALHYGTLKQLT